MAFRIIRDREDERAEVIEQVLDWNESSDMFSTTVKDQDLALKVMIDLEMAGYLCKPDLFNNETIDREVIIINVYKPKF